MAGAPLWKVYTADREYIAACKHIEDAASLTALHGDGTTIRCDHRLVCWTEGSEDQPAAESYDHVVEVVEARLQEHREAVRAKSEAGAQRAAERLQAMRDSIARRSS